MRPKLLAMTALVASGVIAAAFFVQSLSSISAQTQTGPRYLPEYTASGDLILPKNFHEWVYVGSPLTPNALNGGKAGFPEFHNVYIEPGSYEIYKKTALAAPGPLGRGLATMQQWPRRSNPSVPTSSLISPILSHANPRQTGFRGRSAVAR